jgi:hypothetical protein
LSAPGVQVSSGNKAKALQLYAAKEAQNFEAERQCAKVRIRAERRAWRIGPRTTAGGPAGETAPFSALIVLACSRVSTQSAICPRVHRCASFRWTMQPTRQKWESPQLGQRTIDAVMGKSASISQPVGGL